VEGISPIEIVGCAARNLMVPHRRLFLGILRRTSPSLRCRSIEIIDAIGNQESLARLKRVASALELIESMDPVSSRWVHRAVRRIVIFPESGTGYDGSIAVLGLDATSVQHQQLAWLASAIVHEATHARLWRMGIPYRLHLRPRIERLATRQQVAFLSAVPGADSVIAAVEAASQTPWWQEEDMVARAENYMRANGAPSWFAKLYGKVAALMYK
jgi:hypothetical protein